VNEYPWYEIVKKNDPIKQGDLVNSCPTINPVSDLDIGEGKKLSANVDEYDVVVMSQSCDLEHEKIDLVLVCPLKRKSERSYKARIFPRLSSFK
jgi:hypothetical protein